MPPKTKFSRKEVIAAALEPVSEKERGVLTSRDLEKRLGSSAVPSLRHSKNGRCSAKSTRCGDAAF